MNLRVELPPEAMDELVERVTARVLERLEAHPSEPQSEYVTVDEAAEILRCKPQRIYDLCSAGRLERHKDGSRVLLRRADLVALVLPQGSRYRTGSGVAR